MQHRTVSPTLGWSWSGLALGPIALIKHGLWRVFLISIVCLSAIFAVAAAATHLPRVPMPRELLPLTMLMVLILYHFLVASSLSRWRMHRYLHERIAQHGVSVASTGIAGQRLQSDLALLRHRADTTLELPPATTSEPQSFAGADQTGSDPTGEQETKAPANGSDTIARADVDNGDEFANVPDHFFAQALDELRTTDNPATSLRDETAWLQATTIHGDNLDLARSFYIRIRVRQLMQNSPGRTGDSTPGHNLQRASSRRMARLRAYESFVEKVFNNDSPAATAIVSNRPPEVAPDNGTEASVQSYLAISEINDLLVRAGLSLCATPANGYVIRSRQSDAMEIDTHQELEQFLAILAQKMAAPDTKQATVKSQSPVRSGI